MRGDLFERRCPTHDCEVTQSPHEMVLRCPAGHRVYRWQIVDARTDGVIGHAHWARGGVLRTGLLEDVIAAPAHAAMPDRACKRGHRGRWKQREDGRRWRCVECERVPHRERSARWRASQRATA